MFPAALSPSQKAKLIGRSFHALYRWFRNRSQFDRNWSPDTGFSWRKIRHDHSPELINIIEGFYAVEQYVPDYSGGLTQLTRSEYGSSQFYVRWGAEEQRHADLWRNVLLFSRGRTPDQIEQYTETLRANTWCIPWEDPLCMLVYALLQERATEVIYLNFCKITRGETKKGWLQSDKDPILEQVVTTIVIDEVAHYEFFLSTVRLFMYYYPERTAEAIITVLRGFIMPASQIIPNYDSFINDLNRADVFSKQLYTQDVATIVLKNLGIKRFSELEACVLKKFSNISVEKEGDINSIYSALNFSFLENTIQHLFSKIQKYETTVGFNEIDPTSFVPTQWS